MKKRLKGLVALFMAFTMVMSVAPNVTYGVISDEVYEKEMLENHPRMNIEPELLFDMEENFKDGKYLAAYSDGICARVGENPAEIITPLYGEYNYYYVTGFTIWEVKEDGYIYKDSSKHKDVSADYIVSKSDIKEYGNASNYDASVHYPVMVPKFGVRDFSLNVYDENGIMQDYKISYNINSDEGTDELYIPEGYIGYMLCSESVEEEIIYDDDYNVIDTIEVTKYSDVFISSYSDLVREMGLIVNTGYKFKKLVLTKKMPYKVYCAEDEYARPCADCSDNVIWLEPNDKIIDEQITKDALRHHVYDENVEWTVWTVDFCGSAGMTYSDAITCGLSAEEYSSVRMSVDDNIYHYLENYPILFARVPEKVYNIPYYETLDTKGEDLELKYGMLNTYYDCECKPFDGCGCDLNDEYYWCDCQSLKGVLSKRYKDDECPEEWKFIYGDKEYLHVTSLSTIWDIAIDDGEYDSTKAKLIPICKNHDLDYENGVEVSKPTANEKGKTQYTCKACGEKIVKEDIDKLITINSVTLSNSAYTYSGSEYKPAVTVKAYVDSKLVTLTKDDYTVSYKNNKNVGTATVTVTGNGKFAGAKTATFKINPAKITSLELSVKNQYTGKAITGTVVVKAGKTKLKEGTDYTVSYKNNTKIGTATVTVTGKGNYIGTLKDNFTIQPKKVTGLKQSGYATDSITLKWDKVAGAKGYIIYLENASTGKQKSIGESTANSFTVKKLKAGSNYKYAVRAYGLVGNVRVHGGISETKTMITKTATTKVTVKSNAKKKAIITWTKVTGADGYEVYMSTKKSSGYKKITTTKKTTAKYTKTGLTSKKTYYFKVRSYKKNTSGTKVYSAFSSVKSVKVK